MRPAERVISVLRIAGSDTRGDVDGRLSSAVRHIGRPEIFSDWSSFEGTVAGADCAVVVIPWLDGPAEISRVERIRRRAPDVPVIVATSKALETTRRAVELGFTSAVWISDIERQLPMAVRFAIECAYLRRVAANAERAPQLPMAVRGAVAGACRSRTPIRAIDDLAALAGVHRSVLMAAWQRKAQPGLTPKRLLDWVLLLHAVGRKTSAASWESIAAGLRVSEDTLSRVAHRLLGMHLGQLNATTIGQVRGGFACDVLTPLGIRAPLPPW